MTDQPLLSVIIPVYKAERSLRRCVDSLLCQLYTNLEIWLVDDGSPDGSPAICDDYAARDRRVHVIHQPNQGAFAARNAGLDAAGGALIGFVDADDWLEPNMYETLYALLRDTAADIAQCEMVNDGAYQQMRSVTLGGPVTYRREQLTEAMFRNEISHNLMNKLYRAEIWKGFHFQEGLYHLDAAFMCRLPERCARLSRTDAALYHYNTDGGSITRGRRNMAHVRSMQNLFAAYSQAAESAHPDGDFFVCREIPSTGRLLPQDILHTRVRLPDVPGHGPALRWVRHGHHVVGHALHLLRRGGGGADGHAPVYLHRVHGHHLAAEALGQRHTHLRLAAGRGPHHADDLVVHVLTSIRFGKRRSAVMACKVVDFSFCR